jgi:hypothetical protein
VRARVDEALACSWRIASRTGTRGHAEVLGDRHLVEHGPVVQLAPVDRLAQRFGDVVGGDAAIAQPLSEPDPGQIGGSHRWGEPIRALGRES